MNLSERDLLLIDKMVEGKQKEIDQLKLEIEESKEAIRILELKIYGPWKYRD